LEDLIKSTSTSPAKPSGGKMSACGRLQIVVGDDGIVRVVPLKQQLSGAYHQFFEIMAKKSKE
jgi:hypothetical protein